MDLAAAPYGGARYPVEARMGGRTFAKFHLDAGIGDIVIEPLEIIEGRDWLDFAGIPSRGFPMISKEQQFAEKLHAYSLPRESNSRVKDLIDMRLLMETGEMSGDRLRHAIEATFQRRSTHPIPETLVSPPKFWEKPYAAMANECGLPEMLSEAFASIDTYFALMMTGEIQ